MNQREIKFRAWDSLNKVMLNKVKVIHLDDQTAYGYNSARTDKHGQGHWVNSNTGILMQFTGLKDKNGIDIYERDIVKVVMEGIDSDEYVERIGMVAWDCSDALWLLDFGGFLTAFTGLNDRNAEYEVIGSIYENPELLK